MKTLRVFFVLGFVWGFVWVGLGLGSRNAFGALAQSKMAVFGQCQDHGFSGYTYEFAFTYQNPAVPPGSQVEWILGYQGHGSVNHEPPRDRFEWRYRESVRMAALGGAAGAYQGRAKVFYLATGGYLSDLQFVVRVTEPGGRTWLDPGAFGRSQALPHYRAHFFTMHVLECFHLRSPQALPVAIGSAREGSD